MCKNHKPLKTVSKQSHWQCVLFTGGLLGTQNILLTIPTTHMNM